MKIKSLTLLISAAVLALGTAAASAKPDKPDKPKKNKSHHLSFAKADVNEDGALDIFEFSTTQGPGVPMVEIRRRFLPIDVSGDFEILTDPVTGEPLLDPVTGEPLLGDPIPDGLITPEEIADYLAGDRGKSELPRFELADFDGDGVLSPVEFGYLKSQKVKLKNITRQFDKQDADGDGFLTKEEFKKSD